MKRIAKEEVKTEEVTEEVIKTTEVKEAKDTSKENSKPRERQSVENPEKEVEASAKDLEAAKKAVENKDFVQPKHGQNPEPEVKQNTEQTIDDGGIDVEPEDSNSSSCRKSYS